MNDKETTSERGRQAEKPTEIPKRGWLDVAKRVKRQIVTDHIQIVAAGVAFYSFLAIFPALAALISGYGLLVDPAQAASQIDRLAGMLPPSAYELISDFGQQLTAQSGGGLVCKGVGS